MQATRMPSSKPPSRLSRLFASAPATCIEDLRVLAGRRVPRMFYDYADSGSYTEGTYRANEEDFAKIKLRQRVAVDLSNRTRHKDIKNGLSTPPRMTVPNIINLATKPRWCLAM